MTDGWNAPPVPRSAALATGVMCAAIVGCEVADTPTPAGNDVCDAPAIEVALPAAIDESSGVATSRNHEGIFWTHNDSGGDPVIFAVDSTGALRGAVRVEGAANRDWEDIAVGPCEPGSGEDCVFIGEIGDNNARYPHVAVYRVREPDPATDTVSRPVDTFRFTYPDGPRDSEGLFITSAGIHVVSKGRTGPIELFRLPPPYPTNATVELERVQGLAPAPTSMSAQATAAAVDRDEASVIIRTYVGLRFYQIEGDTLRPQGRPADGVAPSQLQGEGADFLPDGRIVLTSEAQAGRPQSLVIVQCDPERTEEAPHL